MWVGIQIGGVAYVSGPDFSIVEIITKKGNRRMKRITIVSGIASQRARFCHFISCSPA
jgi:hypothetical protein